MSPIVYLNEDEANKLLKESIKIPKITPSYFRQEIELKALKQDHELRTSSIYHLSKNVELSLWEGCF